MTPDEYLEAWWAQTPAEERKRLLDAVLADVSVDLLYYDRKGHALPAGAIERMVAEGEATVDDLVQRVAEDLRDALLEGDS